MSFGLQKELDPKSATYWLAAGVGLFLTGLGVNGMLRPGPAAAAFGLPIKDAADYSYVRVKADRDLATGAAIFGLLALNNRPALQTFMYVGALMPLADLLLVWRFSPLSRREKLGRYAIHGSALVYSCLRPGGWVANPANSL